MSETNSDSDVSHISLFSETASESQYEVLPADEFPDCPFNFDCFNDANMLDYKFTDEVYILIYDDRLTYIDSDFHKMTELEKNTSRHYTFVQAKNNKPITVRQILNKMIKDTHYSSRKIQKLFSHYYLEKFEQRGCRTWEACWGN